MASSSDANCLFLPPTERSFACGSLRSQSLTLGARRKRGPNGRNNARHTGESVAPRWGWGSLNGRSQGCAPASLPWACRRRNFRPHSRVRRLARHSLPGGRDARIEKRIVGVDSSGTAFAVVPVAGGLRGIRPPLAPLRGAGACFCIRWFQSLRSWHHRLISRPPPGAQSGMLQVGGIPQALEGFRTGHLSWNRRGDAPPFPCSFLTDPIGQLTVTCLAAFEQPAQVEPGDGPAAVAVLLASFHEYVEPAFTRGAGAARRE